MIDSFFSAPLARWDGLHLVLDLKLVERHLDRLLVGVDLVRGLRLEGRGDAVAVETTVVWKGLHTRVGLDLAELRLRHRHLGLRMRKARILGGVRLPRAALEAVLRALESDLVTVFPGQGILVVDLRRWLPEELDLEVLTVQATARSMHVWFGPGRLQELPAMGPRRLPAETIPS